MQNLNIERYNTRLILYILTSLHELRAHDTSHNIFDAWKWDALILSGLFQSAVVHASHLSRPDSGLRPHLRMFPNFSATPICLPYVLSSNNFPYTFSRITPENTRGKWVQNSPKFNVNLRKIVQFDYQKLRRRCGTSHSKSLWVWKTFGSL